MTKVALTVKALDELKPGKKAKAYSTGIPNLRVLVSPNGTKSFQLRRDGSMVTLGRYPKKSIDEMRRCAVTRETPEEVTNKTRTIGEWIKLYEEERGHKVSIASRAQTMRLVLSPILRREVGALTTSWLEKRMIELQHYRTRLGLVKKYLAGTRRTYQGNVVMLTNFIVERGGLEKPPFRRLTSIPVKKPTDKALDVEDILKLEKWCETATDLKLACFVMIGLRTGMRPGEITSLQRNEFDIDCPKPFIHVQPEKTKAKYERRFRITPGLAKFLRPRLPQLPQRDPFKIGNRNFRFNRMVEKEVNLRQRPTPHWLRHTAITHMLSRGVPVHVVMQIVGHQDMATTAMYAHALEQDQSTALNVLDHIPARRIKPGEEEREKYQGQVFFDEEE